LFALLDDLDRIVLDHGGRLYLAKDVRMTREVFRKGYPGWERFEKLRAKQGMKNKFNSLQSKRLGV
jgi:FAD/FMN-containing dehydrogenase